MRRVIQLKDAANIINAELIGENICIDGLNLCNRKSQYNSLLSYATDEKYVRMAIENNSIHALVLSRQLLENIEDDYLNNFSLLISPFPEVDFYRIHEHLYKNTDFYDHFRFPTKIGTNPNIHPTAIIEEGVIIGDNVNIEAYAIIKSGSILGDNVYIGCHTVIGVEGFQVIKNKNKNIRVTHAGGCKLSNGVAVLHNSVICKSIFEDVTFLGENVMVNSLSCIEHNCYIDAHVMITGSVALCGSVSIQKGAWIGTGTTILNQVTVGENALVGIGSVVTRDVDDNKIAYGVPAKMK